MYGLRRSSYTSLREIHHSTLRQSPEPLSHLHVISLVAATIVVGLSLDTWLPSHGQVLANIGVLAVYVYMLVKGTRDEARTLVICAVIGFLGEVFLCFIWGLYTYRLGNLPIFVPPGHALLFLAGCRAGNLVPMWFPKLVLASSTAVVLAMVVVWGYTAELLWFGLFLTVLAFGRDRRLYSVMLVMALLLELLGTYVGAWVWTPEVPYFGLRSSNPPLSAGAFYCCLDLLVLASARMLTHVLRRRAIPQSIERSRSGD